MSDTNLTAVLRKKGEIKLDDCKIPEPGPGQVQLSMQHVGICGSDVHFWQHGYIGKFVVRAPMVLGHEAAGVVSKLGEGVTTLKVADRVAIEPGVPCRRCFDCKTGRYNLCTDMIFCATPPTDGNLARFYVHDADFCFKLPDHVSTEEGALLEPLSVAVHACRRGGVTLGSKVLVCGAGPIGLVSLLTAKACGASKVCITDINEKRLRTAEELGADMAINARNKDPQDVSKEVADGLGDMADITIECSGTQLSTKAAIFATKAGGCVVLVGLGPSDIETPLVDATIKEIDIRGCIRYANCYPTALEMVASGKVNVKPLITHRFSLEETLTAFEMALKGEGIKVMIKCSK